MRTTIPEEVWAFNDTDTLPIENVPDGQCAINRDTGAVIIFDKETKTWKKLA